MAPSLNTPSCQRTYPSRLSRPGQQSLKKNRRSASLNFAKYSQVGTQGGITGAEVARGLLDSQGLQDVAIESTPGILKDHYDPRSKTLSLSQDVYYSPSVAAAGVAAHEAGHALQDAEDYFPMEARTYIVPIVQLA